MKKQRLVLLLGLVFLFFLAFGKLADIYGELLWFKTMEFSSVFWTILLAKGLMGILFGLGFFLIAGPNIYLARNMDSPKKEWELSLRRQGTKQVETIPIRPEYVNRFLLAGCLILSVLMGVWPSALKWDEFLRFWYQVPFSQLDPIFHKNIGFFVFSYPVLVFLQKWFFYTLFITTIAAGYIYLKDGAMSLKIGAFSFSRKAKTHLSILVGFILMLVAWDKRLKMLGLLYSSRGAVFGAGYTDMHAQLIAYWIIFIIAAVCAFLFWINISSKGWKWPLIGLATLFILSLVVSEFYPFAIQQFIVEPSELSKESPYIQHNIHYTRQGYNLDKIEEKSFQALTNLGLEDTQKNSLTLKNIKLWDKKPLMQSYGELQEMRLYYNFVNVDEDRYTLDGESTQIMLSPRELDQSQLPPQAQTWENQHFKYTHGYGLCMSPVNTVTEKGLPNLLIKNIPPVISGAGQGSLQVTRPEIYYGEKANDFVIVNTASQEFDYPKGDTNVYTRYQGKGGVHIGSYFHRLIFSLKFSDPKILLTSYIKPESQIMFHREIRDLVRTLAPFLTYDRDPYPVVSKEGRIFWIQDAYTTTDKYPYSERSPLFSSDDGIYPAGPLPIFAGQQVGAKMINYIRNSVKVVIDAYDGSTSYYVIDEKDPIIQTYRKMFPTLFKPYSEMPGELRAHIRYPQDLFEIQANMYQLYHMQDVQVFYNKEDLWDLPLQKGASGQEDSPMKGYYVTMRLPEHGEEEFMLMVPFTPRNKSNMIAWICAQCDGQDYGKLLLYKFPKEKLIYGPRQVEARIDQQTDISRELTLWSQQGSEVFRGDLLVIPIEKSVLYIEPVYLSASGGSQLPELKRVIVAYGDKIEMKPTLPEALQAVFGGKLGEAEAVPSPATSVEQSPPSMQGKLSGQSMNELVRRADQYFQQAMESLRNGNWTQYGQRQEDLRNVIQELLKASEGK